MSTDNTVENIQAGVAQPWDTITDIREVCYDNVSEKWYACGSDGAGNGKIDSSPDGINWTNVDSRAGDEYLSIAVSEAGEFLAVTDAVGTSRISVDGTTWNAGPIWPGFPEHVVFDENLGYFIVTDTSTNLYYVWPNSTVEWDTGYNTSLIYRTPEFMWHSDPVSSAMTATTSFDGTYGEHEALGFWHIGAPIGFRRSEIFGGNGKIMFPYVAADGTSQRAVAYYGAKNDGS